MSNGQLRL